MWFTLEVKIDTGKKSQYSATKSAITIGIISVSCVVYRTTRAKQTQLASVATVASYGAPAAIAASGAAAAGGVSCSCGCYHLLTLSQTAAASSAAASSAAGTTAATSASAGAAKFFTSQSANIAKLSSYLVGKSAKKVSKEYGGMSAVQEEVLSIVKSPDVDSVTRTKALQSLKQLGRAYKSDSKNRSEEEEQKELERVLAQPPPYESLQRTPSSEDTVNSDKRKSAVRVHGLYVKERMEIEVRVVDGTLQLKDKLNDKVF